MTLISPFLWTTGGAAREVTATNLRALYLVHFLSKYFSKNVTVATAARTLFGVLRQP